MKQGDSRIDKVVCCDFDGAVTIGAGTLTKANFGCLFFWAHFKALLPWSESLPDCCRVPFKASNTKPAKPMYSSKKGPLNNALEKLREKYREKDAK